MTRLIVFANRKGGCGKTTTAVNVAHCLAEKKRNVLLLDVDPQAHAGASLGHTVSGEESGMMALLLEKKSLPEVLVQSSIPGLSLVPASRGLTTFEIDNSAVSGTETRLAEYLINPGDAFDYIIMDPPPTVGLLTVMSLAAAKEVYIPMQMHFLAMEGLAEMMRLIYTVNASCNPALRLGGVIPTFFNKNTRLAKEITEDIKTNFGKDKLCPGIRMNISLAEAPGHGKTIFSYAPKSAGAEDYKALADQIDSAEIK